MGSYFFQGAPKGQLQYLFEGGVIRGWGINRGILRYLRIEVQTVRKIIAEWDISAETFRRRHFGGGTIRRRDISAEAIENCSLDFGEHDINYFFAVTLSDF